MESEENKAVETPANPPAEKSKCSSDARICAISFLAAIIVVLAYHGIVTLVKCVTGECEKSTQTLIVRKGMDVPEHHRPRRQFRERGERPERGERREWRKRGERPERRERGDRPERRERRERREKIEQRENAEKTEKAADAK